MVPEALRTVHSEAYLTYLKNACRKLPEEREVFPFLFPRTDRIPPSRLAQRGLFAFDTFTPLGRGTYSACLAAASCSFQGAKQARRKGRNAYCLCRPPGHHATGRLMGGYCYLNNAAVAAASLLPDKVAVLDIDAHHGNGTQEIFYADDRVLFCSVHGDPKTGYPYAWGFADEEGTGRGKGFNLNVPLSSSTTGGMWTRSVSTLLRRIREFDPAYIVVSLGVDGLKEDRNGPFRLHIRDYQKAGRLISDTDCPKIVVQEGGYFIPLIGRCTRAFLDQFA